MRFYYRYTEGSAARNRPSGFMKAAAFESFLSAASQLPDFHLTVVSDCKTEGAPGLDLPDDARIVELGGAGGGHSFEWCLREAVRMPQSDLVYFAEDDYYYLPNAFTTLADTTEELGPDVHSFYFSLYEHPDAYVTSIHPQQTRLRFLAGRHWRELPSTCMTFGASPLRLSIDLDLLLGSISTAQTASWVLFSALQGRGRQPAFWWQARRQMAEFSVRHKVDPVRLGRLLVPRFRTGTPLLAPVPSLATHAAMGALPLGTSWADFGLALPPEGNDR